MSYNYSNNYGLNPNYTYYEFSFDSSQAQRAYNGSYLPTDWPVFALGGKRDLKNVAAIKILEVQIPFGYYVFPPVLIGNYISYTDPLGTTQFVLTQGNYTAAQFVAKLKSELDLCRTSLGGGANAFTVSINPQTGKLAILGFDGGPLVFTLSFPALSYPANYGFGPSPTTYTSDAGGLLVSPYIPQISGPNYLYLNSSTLGTLVNLYLPAPDNIIGGNTGPQVSKVPVNTSPGGIIYWQDPDPQKWFDIENLPILQQTDFFLTLGSNTDVVTLHGLPFSVKLGILLNRENISENATADGPAGMTMKRLRAA